MTSRRARSLILAVGAAGILALSTGVANASAHAQHPILNGPPIITTVWHGPDASEAACMAAAANSRKIPGVVNAGCDYLTYSPHNGAYLPGWYDFAGLAGPVGP